MRVTQLDGGHFTSAAGIWRRGEDMERQMRFPVPAYLIEVGEERILVDTGLHPDAAADAARHYEVSESIGAFGLEQEAAGRRCCPPRCRSSSSGGSGRQGTSPRRSPATSSCRATTKGSPVS